MRRQLRPGRLFAACASGPGLVAVVASVGRDVVRWTVSQALCRELGRDCRSAAGRDFPSASAEPVRQVEPPLRDARQKDVQQLELEPLLPDVPRWVGRPLEQRGVR